MKHLWQEEFNHHFHFIFSREGCVAIHDVVLMKLQLAVQSERGVVQLLSHNKVWSLCLLSRLIDNLVPRGVHSMALLPVCNDAIICYSIKYLIIKYLIGLFLIPCRWVFLFVFSHFRRCTVVFLAIPGATWKFQDPRLAQRGVTFYFSLPTFCTFQLVPGFKYSMLTATTFNVQC